MTESALKTSINKILDEGKIGGDNTITFTKNTEEYRNVNIIGTITHFLKEGKTLVIEDHSGSIAAHWLEGNYTLQPGDTALIIGRVRELGKRYIAPSVIKKTDKNWKLVREKEMAQQNPTTTPNKEVKKEERSMNIDDALRTIHEADKGEGADMESMIQELGSNGEELIKKLLMAGEIFENKPGKLRLL